LIGIKHPHRYSTKEDEDYESNGKKYDKSPGKKDHKLKLNDTGISNGNKLIDQLGTKYIKGEQKNLISEDKGVMIFSRKTQAKAMKKYNIKR
jgi:hypothetical protein